jgi:hypothetical protein
VKNLNQEISKKVDCNCIFYNRLLEKHIKNVIAEIDFSFAICTTECPGKNGTKCDATQIGPTPGPPPP